MTTVVIPFAGVEGKTRLHASRRLRRELSLAMLGDVLAAASSAGTVRVVTSDSEGAALAAEAGADVLDDPGGGQGPAVQAALEGLGPGAILIVNADVPCVVPDDLRALLAATPAGGVALVEALDGTTNALSIPAPDVFAPLYGRDSAARFRAHVESLGLQSVSVAVPNLADDVDTLEDLQRLHLQARAALAGVPGRADGGDPRMKIVVLSGGVGGARFVRGLVDVADPAQVTVIGNVGDDLEVLGMHVSPDLDSILYSLADLNDEERGWGRADETWNALTTVAELGGESWFRLGDRDLGLHLVRTQALQSGEPLSAVTARLAESLGLETRLIPATDDRLRTWITTPAGEFTFQEWFVARGHRDEVDALRFEGAESAAPAPGVLEAIDCRRPASDRAEQSLCLDRADSRACDRYVMRSRTARCRASRSAR